jgi:hypothetical protein
MADQDVPPRRQIRRFDIFAEWNRLKALERKHMDEDDARAYGLAVAKVVAARTLHGQPPEQVRDLKKKAKAEETDEPWWEHLGSSDEFERRVVARMGADFYERVLQPAVREAWDAGKHYEDIRDTLRAAWNERIVAARPREGAPGAANG